MGHDDIYYLADQREPALQIKDLAAEVDRIIPDFSSAAYATWDSLLRSLNGRPGRRTTLCLDEFPYLVQVSPELPSLLQKYIDLSGTKRLNLVLCGSSQRMMHGLVLDQSAPLYGRAVEILKVRPLPAGQIRQGLGLKVGEAKWSAADVHAAAAGERLAALARNGPFARGRKIVPVLWAKRGRTHPDIHILTPDAVLDCLQ